MSCFAYWIVHFSLFNKHLLRFLLCLKGCNTNKHIIEKIWDRNNVISLFILSSGMWLCCSFDFTRIRIHREGTGIIIPNSEGKQGPRCWVFTVSLSTQTLKSLRILLCVPRFATLQPWFMPVLKLLKVYIWVAEFYFQLTEWGFF